MQSQITYTFLIIFSIWFLTLYNRIFDKKLKKYILIIGGLQIFWMIVRIIKTLTEGTLNNFMWYLYYIPMIFIPTFYYISSKYITDKENKNKNISIIISSLLTFLVITNDLHHLVFSPVEESGHYYHKIVYYIICVWIFYQLLMATIILVKKQIDLKNYYKIILPFIPIILGLVYTIMYVKNIAEIRSTNMSVILGTLFFVGLESMLNLKLIPNNLNYIKPYKKSKLEIAIISNDIKNILKTNANIEIPKVIIDDLKNGQIKGKYNLEDDITYIIKQINGGIVVLKKSFKEINKLKNTSLEKNKELKKQKSVLETKQKVVQDLYEIEIRNQILDEVTDKIEIKKKAIEKMITEMNSVDRKKLSIIKLWIGYCKRMSNLVIPDYNKEKYNKEKINILVQELLQDANNLKVKGTLINNDILGCNSNVILKIYDSIFSIIEELYDTEILISILQNDDYIKIIVNIEKEKETLKDKIFEKCKDYIWDLKEKQIENGIKISYNINI